MVSLTDSKPKVRKYNDRMIDPGGIRCAHCARMTGTFASGFARAAGKPLCHPNVPGRPDCYQLVTVHQHEIPCISSTCYEDHEDPKTYLFKPKRRVSRGKGKKT
jgi:hypothetical protein